MIYKLEMILDVNQDRIDYNTGSIFHGFLMENIDKAYAEFLHESSLNPYSQYVYKNEKDEYVWVVNTLNQEAYEYLIKPLQEKDSVYLKQREAYYSIKSKELFAISYKTLLEKTYSQEKTNSYFKIKILSPIAFKIQGSYQVLPDLRAIYRNIMNRFDFFSEDYQLYNQDALDHLLEKTVITDYRLRTERFYLEKTRIPGYLGSYTLMVKGNKTMQDLVNLMLSYAEYSGIGIKTSLGMGAIKLL